MIPQGRLNIFQYKIGYLKITLLNPRRDPYISVTVPFAAKTTKKTKYFTNQKSPKFNEELVFKIPPFADLEDNEEIEISIMDKNYSSDDLNSRLGLIFCK